MLWTECLCPLNPYVDSYPQCDGVRSWGSLGGNEVMRVGHSWMRVNETLVNETQDSWFLSLLHVQPQQGHCPSTRESQQKPSMPAPWPWTSWPLKLWKINVCCLTCLTYGVSHSEWHKIRVNTQLMSGFKVMTMWWAESLAQEHKPEIVLSQNSYHCNFIIILCQNFQSWNFCSRMVIPQPHQLQTCSCSHTLQYHKEARFQRVYDWQEPLVHNWIQLRGKIFRSFFCLFPRRNFVLRIYCLDNYTMYFNYWKGLSVQTV